MDIGGLETEADYGYDGEDEACKFNRSKVAVRVSGGVEISQDEEEMASGSSRTAPSASPSMRLPCNSIWAGSVSLCTPSNHNFHHHHNHHKINF